MYIFIHMCVYIPEKAMAPHSSTLAWKIPWTEEPGGLQSMGLRRVGHDWTTSLALFTFLHWKRKWQPTPVFLPGESQGGGAWWAAVYGVAQNRTWLKQLSSSSSVYIQYVHVCTYKWIYIHSICMHVHMNIHIYSMCMCVHLNVYTFISVIYTHIHHSCSLKSRTILFDLITNLLSKYYPFFSQWKLGSFQSPVKGGNQTISVHEVSAYDMSLCL